MACNKVTVGVSTAKGEETTEGNSIASNEVTVGVSMNYLRSLSHIHSIITQTFALHMYFKAWGSHVNQMFSYTPLILALFATGGFFVLAQCKLTYKKRTVSTVIK